jgi:hypothetical protein
MISEDNGWVCVVHDLWESKGGLSWNWAVNGHDTKPLPGECALAPAAWLTELLGHPLPIEDDKNPAMSARVVYPTRRSDGRCEGREAPGQHIDSN